jgi:hypothetical protein
MAGKSQTRATQVPLTARQAQLGAGQAQLKARQAQLNEILRHLELVQSAVVVAVAALRHQNCELDVDISNVLQRSVADRIQDQIERLEVLSGPRARS